MNPHADTYFHIKILKQVALDWKSTDDDNTVALQTIKEALKKAIDKRNIFLEYKNGARLVYGNSDSLPGLIVDMYEKYILIQINTAGLDRFRIEIKNYFSEIYPSKKSILFDNNEYRKHEVLPTYEPELIDSDLEIVENNLKYKIKKEVIQKIGYYYDHRENREKLFNKIIKMNIEKESGLDLFSYVGSWGLHLLKADVGHVDFVDQANMESNIETNLELNGYKGRGHFFRKDVFKHLDELIANNKTYNIVVSDPPAFTKSEKNKATAIQGYEKLHSKALKIVRNKGLLVVASCTHYVDLNELDVTVQNAAAKNNVSVQLLDIGLQGHDHPIQSLKDKSFYIKYLLYLVQRG
jgi:23S rRNA (cytosine1962-C5)-methyltransferase